MNSGSSKIVDPITDEVIQQNTEVSVSYPLFLELRNHVINLSLSHSRHDLTVLPK